MTRKSVFVGFSILLLLGGVGGAILVLLVRHEPRFYRECVLPAGAERREKSDEFEKNFWGDIVNQVVADRDWQANFSDEQINSFLEEKFVSYGINESLPKGIRSPRISIEQDRLHLAFRYGKEPWSTIITIDLRAWVAKREPNVLILELLGVHAGLLPISAQSLLERFSDVAPSDKVRLTWYRNNGNPTAKLEFRPSVQLKHLEMSNGQLCIVGVSSRARAQLPTTGPIDR